LSEGQIADILRRLDNRIQVSPEYFTQEMLERERNYGVFTG